MEYNLGLLTYENGKPGIYHSLMQKYRHFSTQVKLFESLEI